MVDPRIEQTRENTIKWAEENISSPNFTSRWLAQAILENQKKDTSSSSKAKGTTSSTTTNKNRSSSSSSSHHGGSHHGSYHGSHHGSSSHGSHGSHGSSNKPPTPPSPSPFDGTVPNLDVIKEKASGLEPTYMRDIKNPPIVSTSPNTSTTTEETIKQKFSEDLSKKISQSDTTRKSTSSPSSKPSGSKKTTPPPSTTSNEVLSQLEETKSKIKQNIKESFDTLRGINKTLSEYNKMIEDVKSAPEGTTWEYKGKTYTNRDELIKAIEADKSKYAEGGRKYIFSMVFTMPKLLGAYSTVSSQEKQIKHYLSQGYKMKVVDGKIIFYKTPEQIEAEQYEAIKREYSSLSEPLRTVRGATAAITFGAFSPEFYSRLITQGPESATKYIASQEYKFKHSTEWPIVELGSFKLSIPTTHPAGKWAALTFGSPAYKNVVYPFALGYETGAVIGAAERLGTYTPTVLKTGLGLMGGYATYETGKTVTEQLSQGKTTEALSTLLGFGMQSASAALGFTAGRALGFEKSNIKWSSQHKPQTTAFITEKEITPEGLVKFKGKQITQQLTKPSRFTKANLEFEGTYNPKTGKFENITYTKGKVTTYSAKLKGNKPTIIKELGTKTLDTKTLSQLTDTLNYSIKNYPTYVPETSTIVGPPEFLSKFSKGQTFESLTTGKLGRTKLTTRAITSTTEKPYTPTTEFTTVGKTKAGGLTFTTFEKGKVIDITQFKPEFVKSESSTFITSTTTTPEGIVVRGFQISRYPIGKWGAYGENIINFEALQSPTGEPKTISILGGKSTIKTGYGGTIFERPLTSTQLSKLTKNLNIKLVPGEHLKVSVGEVPTLEIGTELPYPFLEGGEYSASKGLTYVGKEGFGSEAISSYKPLTETEMPWKLGKATTFGEALSQRGTRLKYFDINKLYDLTKLTKPTEEEFTFYKSSGGSSTTTASSETLSKLLTTESKTLTKLTSAIKTTTPPVTESQIPVPASLPSAGSTVIATTIVPKTSTAPPLTTYSPTPTTTSSTTIKISSPKIEAVPVVPTAKLPPLPKLTILPTVETGTTPKSTSTTFTKTKTKPTITPTFFIKPASETIEKPTTKPAVISKPTTHEATKPSTEEATIPKLKVISLTTPKIETTQLTTTTTITTPHITIPTIPFKPSIPTPSHVTIFTLPSHKRKKKSKPSKEVRKKKKEYAKRRFILPTMIPILKGW